MAVKMYDSNGTIGPVDTTQQRQCDSVITTQSDNAWQSLSGLRQSHPVGIGVRLAHKQTVVTFFNLLQGPFIVVPGN